MSVQPSDFSKILQFLQNDDKTNRFLGNVFLKNILTNIDESLLEGMTKQTEKLIYQCIILGLETELIIRLEDNNETIYLDSDAELIDFDELEREVEPDEMTFYTNILSRLLVSKAIENEGVPQIFIDGWQVLVLRWKGNIFLCDFLTDWMNQLPPIVSEQLFLASPFLYYDKD